MAKFNVNRNPTLRAVEACEARELSPHPFNPSSMGSGFFPPGGVQERDKWLNRALLASYGLRTLVNCLDMSDWQESLRDDGGSEFEPLSGYVEGGLRAALRVLAEVLHDDLSEALDRAKETTEAQS